MHAPKKTEDAGIFGLIHTRILSFGMILGIGLLLIGLLLIVLLIFSAALAALGKWWECRRI
jgi:membrane protein